MQDGVFRWAWRRLIRTWGGVFTTLGLAVAAYLLGKPASEARPLEGYVHFGWLPVDQVLVG